MKNFFIAFGVFLIWSFFGLWIYSWLQPEEKSAKLEIQGNLNIQENTQFSKDESTKLIDTLSQYINQQNDDIPPILDEEVLSGLKALSSNGDVIFVYKEGISFAKNNTDIFIPKSSEGYLNKLIDYLNKHPDQELHICSIYSPMEQLLSPNIGIQRADKISTQLIKAGVLKEKIVIKSIIKDILFNEDGINYNSIYFTFKSLDQSRIELLKKNIPKTKIVYPIFSETRIIINKNLQLLLSELITYFNENPNKKIDIVGHTDNIGNSKDNYAIGLKYSKQVRQYLLSKGNFDKSSIRASSKGEAEPIDDNFTVRGRNANRRIEIIFK